MKRTHNIHITAILADGTAPTCTDWDTKELTILQDFFCGAKPTAIKDITNGQFNTNPDTITADKLLTPEEHWQKLITLERKYEFKDIKQQDLIISKFKVIITDKKLREKLIRE